MARSRSKKAKGQPLDDSDIQPGEKITLSGGLSEDGKPAELVRERDGSIVAIDEGHLDGRNDEDMLDTDVMRSMARKRKCDIGKVEYHACRECGKVYTRPCDLTKHEKTHSRPWKCSDPGCKYFELGWPTEKERDRHVNDKHSSVPALYRCLYKPCTYTSKRESNCKQHMEKAHGWDYVRSKSKKGTKLVPTISSPATQSMATPGTDGLSTPGSISNHSPLESSYSSFSPAQSIQSGFASSHGSMSSAHPSGYAPSPLSTSHNIDFNDYAKDSFVYNGGYISPSMSNDRRASDVDKSLTPLSVANGDMDMAGTFEDNFAFDNLGYNVNPMGGIFPQYNIPHQMPTPSSDFNFDFSGEKPAASHQPEFSPNGHGDSTLFGTGESQHVAMESQGFTDFAAQSKRGQQETNDFTLFGEIPNGHPAINTPASMFPDLGDMSMAGFDQGEFSSALAQGSELGDVSMSWDMSEQEMDRYLYGDGSPTSSSGPEM